MILNKNNYYSKKADKEYMSYSQFKNFLECPEKAMAIINGKYSTETSESMLVGSYIDAYLDGELEEFKEKTPEIFNSRSGELKSNFKFADEIISRMLKDKEFIRLLKGKRQVIVTCNIAGVPFKSKIDSLLPDLIVDGKVLKDCNDCWVNGEKLQFYMANRYDIQALIYKTAVKQTLNKDLKFALAVVTKEKEPDIRVFLFSDETLQDAMNEVVVKAPVFNAMKNGTETVYGCGKCDYCKSKKKIIKGEFEIL